MSESAAYNDSSIRFITDTAAEADFFEGSHQRVADAIAVTVQQSGPKTIGLIGRWGSGKSTVIRLVENALAKVETSKFHLFTYDAWIHQSDPPRRAFLEELIEFLSKCGFGNPSIWKDELDELQRKKDETETTTTPVLTSAGRILLVPLFLLPVAFVFSGRPWYDAWAKTGSHGWDYWPFALALVIIVSPLVIAVGLYLWLRPSWNMFSRKFWVRENWVNHKKSHENESILALVSNRHVTHQRTSALKAIEPTAIEFQKMFRRILRSLSKKKDRLVIVVDNLDRLDRDEAIAMWTTIRSFFLGAIGDEEKLNRSNLPTVILPVDASAIRRAQNVSYSNKSDSLGRSFMDKSFDVIFYVAPPVLSNWQSYLRQQMSEAFGSELESSWVHETSRIYRHRADSGDPITPRDINRAVNAIAALWLQSKPTNIPFVSIAYYAVYKETIDDNLVSALNTPVVDISDEDPNWRNSIAALYYGVGPDLATQVFLDAPLRAAISSNNPDSFKAHAKFNGFGTAVERLLDDSAFTEPLHQANLITLLPAIESSEPWVGLAWRRLGTLFMQTNLWAGVEGRSSECIKLLLSHSNKENRRKLLRGIVAIIEKWPAPLYGDPRFVTTAANIVVLVVENAAPDGVTLPKLSFAADDSAFLDLASLVEKHRSALAAVLSSRDTARLAGVLAKQLTAPSGAWLDAKAYVVLQAPPKSWAELIAASSTALQTDAANSNHKSAATIILGGLFNSQQEAEDAVRVNAQGGHLQALLNSTLVQGADEAGARAMTLMLLVDNPISPPGGKSWQEIVNDLPELIGMLDKLLEQWRGPEFFGLFVKQLNHDASMFPIIRPLMAAAIRRSEVGRLPLEELMADPHEYTKHLGPDERLAFLDLLPAQEEFWTKLGAAGLKSGPLRLTMQLIESNVTTVRGPARKNLAEKLKRRSSDRWLATIRDGGEIMDAATKLQSASGRGIAIGEPLFAALTQLMPELIANEQRPYAGRWFEAAGFLAASFKRTLLRNLRDQLLSISPPPRIQDLLAAGGDVLLDDGEFEAKSDECVRLIVLPLVKGGGLTWLVSESARVIRWFQKSKGDTKTVVRESIEEALDGLGDEDKSRAELLLRGFATR